MKTNSRLFPPLFNVVSVLSILVRLLIFPALFCGFLSSCFLQRDPRPPQALEGNIIPVSDVLNLKCALRTGDPFLGEAAEPPWTNAKSVKLEAKKSRGSYKPLRSADSLVYEYDTKSDDRDYLNNFSLVNVISVENKTPNRFLGGGGKIIRGDGREQSLNCAALLNPDEYPRLWAKANYTYDVSFQVFGGYVRALLVAPPRDIPFHALPYSIDIGGGRYAMPLGGYPAQIGSLTEQENADFEATRLLTFLPLPSVARSGLQKINFKGIPSFYVKSCSDICDKNTEGISCPEICRKKPHLEPTHLQLTGNFDPFRDFIGNNPEQKRDSYPKRMFEGKWHYLVTVTGKNIRENFFAERGLHLSSDRDSEIEIKFTRDNMVGYTLNTEREGRANNLQAKTVSASREVFRIPISHKDYHFSDARKQIAGKAVLEEVENQTKKYYNKPFAQIDFTKIKMPYLSYYFSQANKFQAADLDEIVFSEDYFSFVLLAPDETKIRVSMLRLERNDTYKPLYLSAEGWKMFPAFQARKRLSAADALTFSDVYAKSSPIARLDLSQPVVYRFSTITPQEKDDDLKGKYVRNIGREVINLWNQAFEKAGVRCPYGENGECLILDETGDAELGDLRYHALNFTDFESLYTSSGFLGYGPSSTDFETGRVVSTASNNYLEPVYNGIRNSIWRYAMSALGMDISYQKAHFRKTAIRARVFPYREMSAVHGLRSQLLNGSLRGLSVPKEIFGGRSWAGGRLFIDLLFPRQNSPQESDSRLYGFGYDFLSQKPRPITSLEQIANEEIKKEINLRYRMAYGEEPSENWDLEETATRAALHGGCFFQSQGGEAFSSAVYALIEEFCDVKFFYGDTPQEAEKVKSGVYSKSISERMRWLELGDQDLLEKNMGGEEAIQYELAKKKHRDDSIKNCAMKLLPIVALKTAIHETGHNLQMFHNFAGSYDKSNFSQPFEDFDHKYIFSHLKDYERTALKNKSKDERNRIKMAASTIMDYSGMRSLPLAPGEYDVGFVRFIYGSQLELKPSQSLSDSRESAAPAGEIVSVEPFSLKKIDPSEKFGVGKALKAEELRAYKVCTDYDLFWKTDPYCDVWDTGTTAAEITQNHYDYHIKEHDDPWYFFMRTLPIYHEWRNQLAAYSSNSSGAKDTTYLTDYSREDFEEELASIEKSAREEDFLADLYEARNIIFEGLFDYFFHQKDHYCVLKDDHTGKQRFAPFSKIQKSWANYSQTVVGASAGPLSSCYDIPPLLRNSAESAWKTTGELGRPVFNTRFDLNKGADYLSSGSYWPFVYDRKGSFIGRLGSGIALIIPWLSPASYENDNYVGVPLSLMDEPDIREKVIKALLKRLLKGETFESGAKVSSWEKDASGNTKLEEKPLKGSDAISRNFSNEEILWKIMSKLIILRGVPNPFAEQFLSRQSFLESIVGIVPLPRLQGQGNVDIFRINLFIGIESGRRGYMLGESKELNPNQRTVLGILPFPNSPASAPSIQLLQGLKDLDIARSRLNLAQNFRAVKEEIDSNFSFRGYLKERDTVKSGFERDYAMFRGYIEDLGWIFSALMAHEEPYVNALALSLAYDYLEKGEKTVVNEAGSSVFVTDMLVSSLQAGWAFHFEMSQAFKEKCKSLGIVKDQCPETRLFPYSEEDLAAGNGDLLREFNEVIKETSQKNYGSKEDFFDKVVYYSQESQPEEEIKVEIWEYNSFKPHLKYLNEYFDENPEELINHKKLILDLYTMEMFRSPKHEQSDARAILEDLVKQLKSPVQGFSNGRQMSQAVEISEKIDSINGVKQAIFELRKLRHFQNSKILQDIFIRRLILSSRVNSFKISDFSAFDEKAAVGEGRLAAEKKVFDMLKSKNPALFILSQMQYADQGFYEIALEDLGSVTSQSLDFLETAQKSINKAGANLYFRFHFEGTRELFSIYQGWFKGNQHEQKTRLNFSDNSERTKWFEEWLALPAGSANRVSQNPINGPETLLRNLIKDAEEIFSELYPYPLESNPYIFERNIYDLFINEMEAQRKAISNALLPMLLRWDEDDLGGGFVSAAEAASAAKSYGLSMLPGEAAGQEDDWFDDWKKEYKDFLLDESETGKKKKIIFIH